MVDQLWVVGISGGCVEFGNLILEREAVGHFGSPSGRAEQMASWSKMGGDTAEGRQEPLGEVPPEKWTGGYATCAAALSDCS